jgi:hypothetical protein
MHSFEKLHSGPTYFEVATSHLLNPLGLFHVILLVSLFQLVTFYDHLSKLPNIVFHEMKFVSSFSLSCNFLILNSISCFIPSNSNGGVYPLLVPSHFTNVLVFSYFS